MNNNSTQLINILTLLLIPIVIVIFALISFLIYIYFKDKEKSNKNSSENTKKTTKEINITNNKQSIFNFMEFDTIKDNMVIQKNGTKYLMVIECQGINYDLMSGVEKTSVEEGFLQFLNTLRYQIQIYIQTRSINLESSIDKYKERINEIESKLRKMQMQYDQMLNVGTYSEEELQKTFFEITKQSNLYEYGLSVLQETERISLNKNILSKKYYIIISYYSAEIGNDKLGKSEIKEIAFSELYTKSQSIIRSISSCGVRGKILNSNDLIELLYMAYNREEAETFGLRKALKAGYNELYSTAPDVMKKKMKELDKEIEEKAIEKARTAVDEVKLELQQQVEEKEESMEDIIEEMAKLILKNNEKYLGNEVKEKAIKKIENERNGGEDDGKKKTRGRKKQSSNEKK